jgi:hypothetical protein
MMTKTQTLESIRNQFIGAESSSLTQRERNILRALNYSGLFPTLVANPETDSLTEFDIATGNGR